MAELAARSTIIMKFEEPGEHFWKGASGEFETYSHPHPHTFVVEAEVEVFHTEREIEFISFAAKLRERFAKGLHDRNWRKLSTPDWPELAAFSCEAMAQWLVEHILELFRDSPLYEPNRYIRVVVREDGIHGGAYERKPA